MKQNLLKAFVLFALLLCVKGVSAQVEYNDGVTAPIANSTEGCVTAYDGNSTPLQKTIAEFKGMLLSNGNAMAVISGTYYDAHMEDLKSINNLIIEDVTTDRRGNATYSYECMNFKLVDGKSWYSPVSFKAYDLSYTRGLSPDGVNSACLPFEISKSKLAEVGLPTDTKLLEFFLLTPNPDNTVTLGFNQRDVMPAGQPFLFVTPESFKGTTWNVAMSDITIKPKVVPQGALFGDYKQVTIGKNKFVPAYSREKLWRTIDDNDTSGPFRAYCAPNWDPTKYAFVKMGADKVVETTSIMVADDEEKVVSEIFSINGIKQDELKDGINIVRMSNGTTKKIIK